MARKRQADTSLCIQHLISEQRVRTGRHEVRMAVQSVLEVNTAHLLYFILLRDRDGNVRTWLATQIMFQRHSESRPNVDHRFFLLSTFLHHKHVAAQSLTDRYDAQ